MLLYAAAWGHHPQTAEEAKSLTSRWICVFRNQIKQSFLKINIYFFYNVFASINLLIQYMKLAHQTGPQWLRMKESSKASHLKANQTSDIIRNSTFVPSYFI